MPALPLPIPTGDDETKEDGAGRPALGDARPRRSETKTLVIKALKELDRAATSAEVYGMLDGAVPLGVIESDLCELVQAKIVEMVVLAPELHFRILPGSQAITHF